MFNVVPSKFLSSFSSLYLRRSQINPPPDALATSTPAKTQRSAPKIPRARSRSKIQYRHDLIAELRSEHEVFFSELGNIKRCAQRKMIAAAQAKLAVFKDRLVDHLLKVNTSVYIYLRDTERSAEMKEQYQSLKVEMEKIGYQLRRLVDDMLAVDKPDSASFLNYLEETEDLLRFRVNFEEKKVYPQYR